jgi:hypothetical protein
LAGTEAGPDGTFAVSGIESGARRIQAVGPTPWLLKGIYVDGRDVADHPLEFGEETVTSDVRVVFTSIGSPLTVTLEQPLPESIVTVFVFPEDSSLWYAGSRRMVALTAIRGRVVFDALPPGEYLAAAIVGISPDALKAGDARLLEQLRPLAQNVQLVERTPASVRLRVRALTK